MVEPRPGLLVLLQAKPAKQKELIEFLNKGLPLVAGEPGTQTWYAFQISDDRFGIYDMFRGENARQEHLSGKLASALRDVAEDLLAVPPEIRELDVLAAKLS